MQVAHGGAAGRGEVAPVDEWLVERVTGGSARRAVENELDRRRVGLPIYGRLDWPRDENSSRSWLYVARTTRGALAALCADVHLARSLPGHLLVRVPRFGWGCAPDAVAPLVRALRADLDSGPRLLRCRLRLVEPDAARREQLRAAILDAGFHGVDPEWYGHTVCVDLRRPLPEILSSFARGARRNINETERRPLVIRAVHDPAFADRLQDLLSESFRLTGGEAPPAAWPQLLRFAQERPSLVRLVGLFRRDRVDPEGLLAFTLAVRHGRDVEYWRGGATRRHGLGRVSLTYALQWDIMRWAHRLGAETYDMGGVPVPGSAHERALRGIARFKGAFGTAPVPAADEFEYIVRPVRNRVALALGRFLKLGSGHGAAFVDHGS